MRKILLVDDNPVSQKITSKMFEHDGYEVFLAWDQKECLRIATEQQPHAIIMDIIFPDADGRDIVRRLKEIPALEKTPVIFATNTINVKDDKGDLTIDIDGNVFRAFAKPLHYPKLLSVVRKEINRIYN